MKIFVDSDVIISSLLSSSGAAYFLINNSKLELVVSNISLKEMEKVIAKLDITLDSLNNLIKKQFKIVKVTDDISKIKKVFGQYTSDPNDAHIIAGVVQARARFLISYNVKDYKTDKIKQDLNIIVTTPANFLQYLRSL